MTFIYVLLDDQLVIPSWRLISLLINKNFQHYITSNVTSVTEVRSASTHLFADMWHPLVLLQQSIMFSLTFIVKCSIARFLCTMRAFEVRASSSSPRLPLCQILILFLSRTSLLS